MNDLAHVSTIALPWQDRAAAAALCDKIRRASRVNQTLTVPIQESNEAAPGAYALAYDSDSDHAEVVRTHEGATTVVFAGRLVEAVAFVQDHLWATGGPHVEHHEDLP